MQATLPKYFFVCYSQGMPALSFYKLRLDLANVGLKLQFVNKNFSKSIQLDSCNYIIYSVNSTDIIKNFAEVNSILGNYELNLLGIFDKNTYYNLQEVEKAKLGLVFFLRNILLSSRKTYLSNLNFFKSTLSSVNR